jgi:oxygen-independent coproporphyrinogen-3 oxidase
MGHVELAEILADAYYLDYVGAPFNMNIRLQPSQRIQVQLEDTIRTSKTLVKNKIMPILNQEPRLLSRPSEYTHAVKFAGEHRVDGETLVNLARETLSKEREISLYVHMPVCRYRCTFCHYPILVSNRDDEIDLWVRTVIKESELYQQKIPQVRDCKVTSLYIGGGTPTLMNTRAFELLLTHFRKSYQLDESVEITVEGTPDSCTPEKIRLLENLAVDRVSVGIQTLDDAILRSVNRQHTASQALECVSALVASKIPTVNFDMIYGFPNQTVKSFVGDLDKILSYQPTSVTLYRIRLNRPDEGPTAMLKSYEKEPKKFPSLDEVYTMQAAGRKIAEGYGYHEEPSGWFSRPGSRVQVYKDRWIDQKPMIGFGWHTYSYSKWWEYHNCGDRGKYLSDVNNDKLPIDFGYMYTEEERQRRFLAFKLKSQFQLNEREFRALFGEGLVWSSVIELLRKHGLIERNSLKLNPVGKVLVEEFIEKFLVKSATF